MLYLSHQNKGIRRMNSEIKVGEIRIQSQSGDSIFDINFIPESGLTCLHFGETIFGVPEFVELVAAKINGIDSMQEADEEYDFQVHLYIHKRLRDVTHNTLLKAMFVPNAYKKRFQRQVLVWTGEPTKTGGMGVVKYPPIPFNEGYIRNLYTLYKHTDHDNPPALPFKPVHNENAFIEDRLHDWRHDEKNGRIHFFSRIADQAVWLLAEVEE